MVRGGGARFRSVSHNQRSFPNLIIRVVVSGSLLRVFVITFYLLFAKVSIFFRNNDF